MIHGGNVLGKGFDASVGFGQYRSWHLEHRVTLPVAVGFLVLGALVGSAAVAIFEVKSHKPPTPRFYSSAMAKQLALTSGYRAVLTEPVVYGN